MKLCATVKNERGGRKTTADNTRIQVELTYGNRIIGTMALYAIIDDKVDGYRVLWNNKIIEEIEKDKSQK